VLGVLQPLPQRMRETSTSRHKNGGNPSAAATGGRLQTVIFRIMKMN